MTESDRQFNEIVKALAALGVRPDAPLLVHSSVKSLGPLSIGLDGVIGALKESVREAPLLLPTLSYEGISWSRPVFDARTTPSCVGILPEYFRTLPGVRRSCHITHSVAALGDDDGDFVGEHHLDTTPGGPHSPFRRLADHDGQILMLGCGLKPNTSMHAIEELILPDYLFLNGVFSYEATDSMGVQRTLATRRHDFAATVQRYDRITEVLDPGTELREGRVLKAHCHLIQAHALWEKVYAAMKADPVRFVDRARQDSTRDQ
ncbi:MAG: AAC(3) family N-acetyltransferase [Spirochaetales bacterium]|nr:MAG: AAC(3) family N-acetyltransferase [Spirochaetales bacterium]